MSQSYNEVQALVKRAARGVNQPWGMADEAAKATRWLAERGMPGPESMVQLLELYDSDSPVKPVVDKNHWHAVGEALLCPVITGTVLSDFSMLLAQHDTIRCSNIVCPLLLLPFAAQASLSIKAGLSISWDSVQYVIEGNRVASQIDLAQHDPLSGTHTGSTELITIQVIVDGLDEQLKSDPSLREIRCVERASVNTQCWNRLAAFAHRTYAPASDESRKLGAGAGDSDSD